MFFEDIKEILKYHLQWRIKYCILFFKHEIQEEGESRVKILSGDCWGKDEQDFLARKGNSCSSEGRFQARFPGNFCVFREVLLVSQQSRTEQLQEALRQKVRSEDSWRDKVTLGGVALSPRPQES